VYAVVKLLRLTKSDDQNGPNVVWNERNEMKRPATQLRTNVRHARWTRCLSL
jgi:hypothetical protein